MRGRVKELKPLEKYIEKAATLIEALPYIQHFREKIIVVKYGGSTMKDGAEKDTVLKDIVFLSSVGICPVIVHGGGPAINKQLKENGVETRRINGLRVTDAATMKVVESVLVNEVNVGIVREIEALGGRAKGLSAKNSGIMRVRKHFAQTPSGAVDLGFVGDVDSIDINPLLGLLVKGCIPVIAPIGCGPEGDSYNVNADTAAGQFAAALSAEKLVFLTDVVGILRFNDKPDTLLSSVRVNEVAELLEDGVISGGMIPKIQACVNAVEAGVSKTHIVGGSIPHSMLLEIFTRAGVGTEIIE
jgi:acetylglutamate kinase